jgi:MYXO-CTERM domain-containing protein
MADVTGYGIPELAITGNASTIVIVPGIQPPREPGEQEQRIIVIDSNNHGPLSNVNGRLDKPLLNTFTSGSFTDLDQDGQPDFTTGGAGLSLAANLAGGYKNEPFSHQLGVWLTTPDPMNGRGLSLPGFPQRVEDYMFFVNPTSADVNGDGYPEMTVGTGGYYVHAIDACGREAEGWPKFVGGWVTAAPALGDVDGDGLLEMAVTTRAGYLYLFDTDGPADGSTPWPEYRHDSHNTGNYDAPLTSDGRAVTAATPIECDLPSRPDAGVDDGGMADAGAPDGGAIGGGGGGCGCRVGAAPSRFGSSLLGGLFLLGLVLVWRRRP